MLVDKVMNTVAGKLRFPGLLILVSIVFVVDLFVPDIIPFVDEILLGLATIILSRWRHPSDKAPEKAIESEENRED